MKYDDLYPKNSDSNDNIDKDKENIRILLEQLNFEQQLVKDNGIKNAFTVNTKIVNTRAYHAKFENLPVNEDVRKELYLQAGRLLDFCNGKENEHALAVNARTGKFIVDNFNREGNPNSTGFTAEEAALITSCKDNVVIVHNHSRNGPPSARDLIAYAEEEKLIFSMILCHDGNVYGIYSVSPKFEPFYKERLDNYLSQNVRMDIAKRLAMTDIYEINEALSDRHKLFDVRRE